MRIGVLGGGQLGRMLWEASCQLVMDLRPSSVYHSESQCPASYAGATVTVGEISESEKLQNFLQRVDGFAIESEFLDVDAIERAWGRERKAPAPSFAGLRIAQDKLEQKKFFRQNGLPTSEFQEITRADLETPEVLTLLHRKWQGFVLKKARMGYDGKGNFAIPSGEALDLMKIRAFCDSAFTANSRVYAEAFVPFTKEVALVSCQSFAGDFGHYPLIETQQKNGVCFLAFKALNEKANEIKAVEIARVVAKRLQILGTFAVEFFVTHDNDLLVNEMAPRVHNSGHFTQRAARSSQFQMHLKSYWQKTFDAEDFDCAGAFAMVNLLGPKDLQGPVSRPKSSRIYWYDKEKTSPGRKLGHIIASGASSSELPQLIENLKAMEQQWQESLRAP